MPHYQFPKWLVSGFTGVVAILEPAIPFVAICILAIIFDCYTAWRLSRRVKKTSGLSSAKFQSRKAEKIIDSSINALLFIVLAMLVNDHVTVQYGNLYLPNLAAAIVVGVQLVSVGENISSCNNSWWARILQLVFIDKSSRHYDINNTDMSKKTILSRFLAKTPRKWKKIRNTAATFLAALTTVGGLSSTIPNAITPVWFPTAVWYAGAVLILVIAWAQSKEEVK